MERADPAPMVSVDTENYQVWFYGVNPLTIENNLKQLEDVINNVQPDIVSLELCPRRACEACDQHRNNVFHDGGGRTADGGLAYAFNLIRELGFLAGLLFYAYAVTLSNLPFTYASVIQRYITSSASHFKKPFEIHMSDRPVEITLQRQVSCLSLLQKIRLLVQVSLSLLLEPLFGKSGILFLLYDVCRMVVLNKAAYLTMTAERNIYVMSALKLALTMKHENKSRKIKAILVTEIMYIDKMIMLWRMVDTTVIRYLLSPSITDNFDVA